MRLGNFTFQQYERTHRRPPISLSFAWLMLGTATFSISQWAVVSTLTKVGTASSVGEYAFALAIVTPIFLLTNLQLRAVHVTDAGEVYDFADFAALRVVTSIMAFMFTAVVSYWFCKVSVNWHLVLIIGAAQVVDSFSDLFAGLQQKRERLDRLAISLILRGILSFLAFAITFTTTHSLLRAATGTVVAWTTVFLGWDLPMAKQVLPGAVRVRFSMTRLFRLAVHSFPLGLVMMLISLNINIPRYALKRSTGMAELGIFVSLAYPVMVVSLLVNGLGQSVSARLAKFFALGEIGPFKSLLKRLCGIGALLGCASVVVAKLFGRVFLLLIYSPKFSEYSNVLVILAAGSGVAAIASFLGYGITAAGAFKSQLFTISAALTTTFVASWVLVPRWNIPGAALALLLGSVVQGIVASQILQHALRVREEHVKEHLNAQICPFSPAALDGIGYVGD